MAWLEEIVEEEPPEPEEPLGIIVTGNLEPDMHVGAKELVRRALKAAGFKTIDLGGAVPAKDFAKKAKEVDADAIAVSINTYSAKDEIPELVSALEAEGIKDKIVVLMGGAAVKQVDAEEIGALYGRNKEQAIELMKEALKV